MKIFMLYAGLVLAVSIPVYYLAINMLWKYELDEHHIILTPEDDREDRFIIIGAVMLLTVLFFALLLVGFVLLNRRISGRLWQPFYKSLAKIKDFDLTQNNTIDFEKSDIAEFAELNESLHKLIAGNMAAFNQQKEFADNASHELQTPLAIIQSKLELLLQNQSLTTEQYNIIEDALKALARASRIKKNLLLLTKIENSQFMEKESINISDLLTTMIPQFATISAGKQIDLKTDIQPGIEIAGNPILVEILFNNLIINAIRHSAADNVVFIDLSTNSLVISNPGMQPLQSAQLFKRFATASSKQPGTGLGLALVKQICNRYNWNIRYAFTDNQHVFSLHFDSDFLPN
jgi:signal transduction histidine kinase